MGRFAFSRVFSITSLVTATLLGLCAVKVYQLRGELSAALLRVAYLEDQVRSLSGALELAQRPIRPLEAPVRALEAGKEPVPLAEEAEEMRVAANPPPAGAVAAGSDEKRALWAAQQSISELEEHIVLEADEKAALTEALKAQYVSGAGSFGAAPDASIVSAIIGSERTAEWEKRRHAARQSEIEERVTREAIVLSRKIKLNPDQEQKAAAALRKAEEALALQSILLKERMKEAMSNHFGGEDAKERLKEQFNEIQALQKEIKSEKDRYVFEELSPSLSDEQKNMLLAEQTALE